MIENYLSELEYQLTDSPIVVSHIWLRYRASEAEGSFRIRGTLMNGDTFELAEFVILDANSEIEVVTYSYHWQNTENQLIMRWDNAKHHPQIRTFPHHVHIDNEDNVHKSTGMDVDSFLKQIEQILLQ